MYQKSLPVGLDYNNFEVYFGKAKVSAFARLKSGVKDNYHLINEILYGQNIVCTDPKKVYTEFTKEVGVTPKTAINVINDLGWKVIAGDFTSAQIFKWCYPRGCKRQLSKTAVHTLHKMKDTIKQMLTDGQENLIPIVLNSQMTPKEIKDSLQKHQWKKLTKVSFTKAQYISRTIQPLSLGNLGDCVELSPSYLQMFSGLFEVTGLHKIVNNLAGEARCLSSPDKVLKIHNTVRDTIMMAGAIGYPINQNWSLRRWEEEHKIVARKRRVGNFSDKVITVGIYPQLPKEIVSGTGDKAVLLDNPLSVALEGDMMGHCVAGYAGRCATGDYVVYHLTLSNGTEGTLGCTVVHQYGKPAHRLLYQQCYGKYNDPIDKTFARWVIDQVNLKLEKGA
jgi:hypothetical protein